MGRPPACRRPRTTGRGHPPGVPPAGKSIASAEDPSVAPPLEHDTMVAAYLIDPARRGYPLAELAGQEGLAPNVKGGDDLAERAVIPRVIAERQRERLEEEGLTRLF